MHCLKPAISFKNRKNAECWEILKKMKIDQNLTFSDEYFFHIKRLWQDQGVQECYNRSNEYNLIDSAK